MESHGGYLCQYSDVDAAWLQHIARLSLEEDGQSGDDAGLLVTVLGGPRIARFAWDAPFTLRAAGCALVPHAPRAGAAALGAPAGDGARLCLRSRRGGAGDRLRQRAPGRRRDAPLRRRRAARRRRTTTRPSRSSSRSGRWATWRACWASIAKSCSAFPASRLRCSTSIAPGASAALAPSTGLNQRPAYAPMRSGAVGVPARQQPGSLHGQHPPKPVHQTVGSLASARLFNGRQPPVQQGGPRSHLGAADCGPAQLQQAVTGRARRHRRDVVVSVPAGAPRLTGGVRRAAVEGGPRPRRLPGVIGFSPLGFLGPVPGVSLRLVGFGFLHHLATAIEEQRVLRPVSRGRGFHLPGGWVRVRLLPGRRARSVRRAAAPGPGSQRGSRGPCTRGVSLPPRAPRTRRLRARLCGVRGERSDLHRPRPDLQRLRADLQRLRADLQRPRPDLHRPRPDLHRPRPDLHVQIRPRRRGIAPYRAHLRPQELQIPTPPPAIGPWADRASPRPPRDGLG